MSTTTTLFRLCAAAYKDDLSGTGARLFGGRWNSPGFPLLYAASSISLALLELMVHSGRNFLPINYYLLRLQVPEVSALAIQSHKLKKNWVDDMAYTRFMGDEFIKNKSHLFIRVPSAIVPEENNVLLNPLHADFKKIKIIGAQSFEPDKRLHIDAQ
jgi:RES domain-containing protein